MCFVQIYSFFTFKNCMNKMALLLHDERCTNLFHVLGVILSLLVLLLHHNALAMDVMAMRVNGLVLSLQQVPGTGTYG